MDELGQVEIELEDRLPEAKNGAAEAMRIAIAKLTKVRQDIEDCRKWICREF